MFCSLPAMTLRALNESHLVCSVRFRQRRSIYKELTVYTKSIQNGSLEKLNPPKTYTNYLIKPISAP